MFKKILKLLGLGREEQVPRPPSYSPLSEDEIYAIVAQLEKEANTKSTGKVSAKRTKTTDKPAAKSYKGSYGSTREDSSSRRADNNMTDPLNPANPLNPVYYGTSSSSSSHSSSSSCDSHHSSHSSSYDSGSSSSSYDSGSSSSSSCDSSSF